MAESRRGGTAKEVFEGSESGRAAEGHQPCRPRALHCDRFGWPDRAGREPRNTRRDEAHQCRRVFRIIRPKLEQVRATIRKAVPDAAEGIGYRMPGYKLHGKPMLYFAGFKEHYSLFAASGTFFAALEDELRGYELLKGTVHFLLTKPVPVKLISRIAKLRAAGISSAAKKPLPSGRKRGRKSAQ
jgi:uncharacterized protein YdhG (YjbR/CyaY superfamily)